MEINQHQQESIDRFLRGALHGEDLDNFYKEIEDNPIMAKALKTQQSLAEGIEFHGNQKLKKRLQKISQEARREKPAKRPQRVGIIRLAIITAAAVILFLVVNRLFFSIPNPQRIFVQYYQPSELSLTRQTDLETKVAQLEDFYTNENYEEAIPLFRELLAAQTENNNLRLALGNALLNTGDSEEAITQFQNILDRNDPLYTDQAKWYLALAFLKRGDQQRSKPFLKELIADPEADFHDQAVEVLEKLGTD